MEKILVFGNDATLSWVIPSESVHFELMISNVTLNEVGERTVLEFVHRIVPNDITALVIDAENIQNNELCLAFAMAVRLSLLELKSAALVPIIFVTDSTILSFKGSKYSQIVLTDGVYFESRRKSLFVAQKLELLTEDRYMHGCIDRIILYPNAHEGRHSLANQWGADVLNRVLFGGSIENDLIRNARLSLYFRYVQSLSYSLKDVSDILIGGNQAYNANFNPIDASRKRIMLIDDEADKGWSDVLERVFDNADEFVTYCEKVPDYSGLSEDARLDIESGRFDLFLLDLRMNGVQEEENVDPIQFSGMRILKKIKEFNRGNQVIILTASNKAWNMKALLDAGADGYYIKESPEYGFQLSYSHNNADVLIQGISKCLEVSLNLRRIWEAISAIKAIISNNNISNKYFEGLEAIKGLEYQRLISEELDIVWNILQSSNPKRCELAMLSMYKCLEYLCEIFFTDKLNGNVKSAEFFDQNYSIRYFENGVWYDLYQEVPFRRKGNNKVMPLQMYSTTNKVVNIMNYCRCHNDQVYATVRQLGKSRNDYIHPQNSAKSRTHISMNNIEDWIMSVRYVMLGL